MKNQLLKWSLFFTICILPPISLADQATEISKFFSVEKNIKGYEVAVSSGQIKQSKEKFISACLDNKINNKNANCDCYKKKLDTISDKEFFYESVIAFRQYQEKVAALKAKNQKKYDELKEIHSKHIGLSKQLENACGKI